MKGGTSSSSRGLILQGHRKMCLFYLFYLQKPGQNHEKSEHLTNTYLRNNVNKRNHTFHNMKNDAITKIKL